MSIGQTGLFNFGMATGQEEKLDWFMMERLSKYKHNDFYVKYALKLVIFHW